MLHPFGTDSWRWLAHDIDIAFHEGCIRINGLMGIYYPGYDQWWVDYDEGLLYD